MGCLEIRVNRTWISLQDAGIWGVQIFGAQAGFKVPDEMILTADAEPVTSPWRVERRAEIQESSRLQLTYVTSLTAPCFPTDDKHWRTTWNQVTKHHVHEHTCWPRPFWPPRPMLSSQSDAVGRSEETADNWQQPGEISCYFSFFVYVINRWNNELLKQSVAAARVESRRGKKHESVGCYSMLIGTYY